jgi:pyrophosphatase PpaX
MVGEIFLIKAVLFDLDGTLVNTNQLIIEIFKHVFKTELNIYPGEEEIVQYFGEPLLQTLARYDEKNTMKLYNTYIQSDFCQICSLFILFQYHTKILW